jgi:alanine racemase
MDYLRRTWAEVNLDAVESNYRAIRGCLKSETKICCIVKADAYGHGSERIAQIYESLGADWLAVSNLEEAEQIRRAGVTLPILILGYTPPDRAAELAANDVAQSVVGPEFAAELSREAVKAGVTVRAHIQIDTGMTRVGFFYQNAERDGASLDEIERACRLPGLRTEGVFTHFASADEGEGGRDYTLMQFACFTGAIEKLEKRGIHFELRHCANSAAILDYPEMQLDMVRPGVILYGMMPSECILHKLSLVPTMSVKSTVALVKTVPAGTCVSYGRRFTSSRDTVVATVPIGYADGYLRRYGEDACALVRGRRAPVVGRVCMDQLMLDVTEVPGIKTGDTVTLIGSDGSEAVTADDIANAAGTINYEVVCGIATRVPRVFRKGGQTVGILDYLQRA